MRELTDFALEAQVIAYRSYRDRGGPLGFDVWMAAKDFAPADRVVLRRLYAEQVNPKREAS